MRPHVLSCLNTARTEFVACLTLLNACTTARTPATSNFLMRCFFSISCFKVNGQVVLRFAYAYGFRNIQSILAKARRGKCPYHFVEVMACPSGCVNGGGQIKPKKKEGPRDTRQRVERVRESPT